MQKRKATKGELEARGLYRLALKLFAIEYDLTDEEAKIGWQELDAEEQESYRSIAILAITEMFHKNKMKDCTVERRLV